jgi:hypothetical protein
MNTCIFSHFYMFLLTCKTVHNYSNSNYVIYLSNDNQYLLHVGQNITRDPLSPCSAPQHSTLPVSNYAPDKKHYLIFIALVKNVSKLCHERKYS